MILPNLQILPDDLREAQACFMRALAETYAEDPNPETLRERLETRRRSCLLPFDDARALEEQFRFDRLAGQIADLSVRQDASEQHHAQQLARLDDQALALEQLRQKNEMLDQQLTQALARIVELENDARAGQERIAQLEEQQTTLSQNANEFEERLAKLEAGLEKLRSRQSGDKRKGPWS